MVSEIQKVFVSQGEEVHAGLVFQVVFFVVDAVGHPAVSIEILPDDWSVEADETLQEKLYTQFGKENVKFITKPIENRSKID